MLAQSGELEELEPATPRARSSFGNLVVTLRGVVIAMTSILITGVSGSLLLLALQVH